MELWISKSDILSHRYLGASVDTSEMLDQSIREAMLFDIQPILGQPLFYDVVKKFDANETDYDDLLNGAVYEYRKEDIYFQGVKKALVYYAFARYIKRDGVKFTVAGAVHKVDDFSDPVTDKTRQRLASDDYANAEALKLEIIQFLNTEIDDYPLWNCATKKRKVTFRAIGD